MLTEWNNKIRSFCWFLGSNLQSDPWVAQRPAHFQTAVLYTSYWSPSFSRTIVPAYRTLRLPALSLRIWKIMSRHCCQSQQHDECLGKHRIGHRERCPQTSNSGQLLPVDYQQLGIHFIPVRFLKALLYASFKSSWWCFHDLSLPLPYLLPWRLQPSSRGNSTPQKWMVKN